MFCFPREESTFDAGNHNVPSCHIIERKDTLNDVRFIVLDDVSLSSHFRKRLDLFLRGNNFARTKFFWSLALLNQNNPNEWKEHL